MCARPFPSARDPPPLATRRKRQPALPRPQDAALLHIAEEAMCAPLPPGWSVHLDAAGAEYFHCIAMEVRGGCAPHGWGGPSH